MTDERYRQALSPSRINLCLDEDCATSGVRTSEVTLTCGKTGLSRNITWKQRAGVETPKSALSALCSDRRFSNGPAWRHSSDCNWVTRYDQRRQPLGKNNLLFIKILARTGLFFFWLFNKCIFPVLRNRSADEDNKLSRQPCDAPFLLVCIITTSCPMFQVCLHQSLHAGHEGSSSQSTSYNSNC